MTTMMTRSERKGGPDRTGPECSVVGFLSAPPDEAAHSLLVGCGRQYLLVSTDRMYGVEYSKHTVKVLSDLLCSVDVSRAIQIGLL